MQGKGPSHTKPICAAAAPIGITNVAHSAESLEALYRHSDGAKGPVSTGLPVPSMHVCDESGRTLVVRGYHHHEALEHPPHRAPRMHLNAGSACAHNRHTHEPTCRTLSPMLSNTRRWSTKLVETDCAWSRTSSTCAAARRALAWHPASILKRSADINLKAHKAYSWLSSINLADGMGL